MSKQLKINELKRVVNVDKFSKYANILKDTNNTNEKQIESILNELSTKTPSREVLMKTRLGFILKEISNRETLPKKIRDKALNLRTKWKDFHKRLLLAPKYDVKCDKPTTESRQKARQSLIDSFLKTNLNSSLTFNCDSEEHNSLINDLEFSIFQHCDKLVNNKYFSTIRKCIKLINDNSRIRNEFLSYQIKADLIVDNYLSCLTSPFKNFKTSTSSLQSQACSSASSSSASSSTDSNCDIDDFDF